MTEKELLSMPIGTIVRIKHGVKCHPMYKIGGKLVMDYKPLSSDEHQYGISSGNLTCYQFKASEYEVVYDYGAHRDFIEIAFRYLAELLVSMDMLSEDVLEQIYDEL